VLYAFAFAFTNQSINLCSSFVFLFVFYVLYTLVMFLDVAVDWWQLGRKQHGHQVSSGFKATRKATVAQCGGTSHVL